VINRRDGFWSPVNIYKAIEEGLLGTEKQQDTTKGLKVQETFKGYSVEYFKWTKGYYMRVRAIRMRPDFQEY
jgi:hypothetical protein